MNKEVYVNIKISMPNGSDMSFSDEEIKEIQDYYEKEFSNFDYLVGEINVSFIDEKTKQIDQLKQQLEESFTEEDVEGLIEDRDKTIKFLQKELAEKDKEIEKLKASCKSAISSFVRMETLYGIESKKVDLLNEQLAEKDKEIEKLKLKLDIRAMSLQNINTERIESERNQTQLAIQELEKVKVDLRAKLHLLESGYLRHFVAWRDICDQINKQIKELKGEKDVED